MSTKDDILTEMVQRTASIGRSVGADDQEIAAHLISGAVRLLADKPAPEALAKTLGKVRRSGKAKADPVMDLFTSGA